MSLSPAADHGPHDEPFYLVVLWFVGGALTFFAFGYTMMKGSDLWWHIAGGEYIVEHLGLPSTDPWSFTASDRRWVVDAWLTEVIFFLWSKLFGMASLVWWKWLVITGAFLALMRLLWRLTGNLLAAYLASFLAVAVASPFMDIRPQLFSLLGLVILLDMTLKRDKASFGLVPLFFVWANLHAGFTLGLLLLPILLFPFAVRADSRKRTLIIAAASVLVCLVNPNGIYSFTQPIIYALDTHSPFKTLGEWHPPFQKGGIQSPVYPYAIGAFALSLFTAFALSLKKRQTVDWRIVIVGLLTLAMSLTSRRFISSFAIGQSLLLAMVLASVMRRVSWRWSVFAYPAASVLIGAYLLLPYPQRSYAFEYLTAEHTFPIATVDMINKNEIAGDVFAYYNWGGYLHLKTKGRLKVFIDGRASAAFESETYLDYVKVLNMGKGWIDVVERSGAPYFLWPLNNPRQLQRLKETGKWKSLYNDAVSELLVRTDHPLPAKLEPAPASIYSKLGDCYRIIGSGKLSAAEACVRQVSDEAPHNYLALDQLIRLQIAQGKIDESRKTSDVLQRVFPQKEHAKRVEKLIRSK